MIGEVCQEGSRVLELDALILYLRGLASDSDE